MAELCVSQTRESELLLKLRVSELYIFPPVLSKSIDCVFVYANMYRQDHGFDPPRGSHQLPGLAL